jgi:hypothetical protein
MITFTHETTRFTVKPEKQALIEAYCSKITKRTGRATAEKNPRWSSNPVYPRFMEGTSTAFYVCEYERANAYRFEGQCMGQRRESLSLFDSLSTNPQFSQDDSHIEEVMP